MSLSSKTERGRALLAATTARLLIATLVLELFVPTAALARSSHRSHARASDHGSKDDAVKQDRRDVCLRDRTCKSLYENARKLSQSGLLDAALASYRAAFERRKAQWLLISIGRTVTGAVFRRHGGATFRPRTSCGQAADQLRLPHALASGRSDASDEDRALQV